jgi:hypothetical protein
MKTVDPALKRLRRLVADARTQLAELETDYAREKSRVAAMQAALLRILRGHYHKRDRLQLAVDFRQKFLDSFVRDDTDEAEQAENEFEQAMAQLDKDYEKLAALDKRKPLKEEPGNGPLRKARVKPGLGDKDELAQLKHQRETLPEPITAVTEALKALRKSPDYKLCRRAQKQPGVLEKIAAERVKQLELENAELEKEADRLARAIKKLSDTP